MTTAPQPVLASPVAKSRLGIAGFTLSLVLIVGLLAFFLFRFRTFFFANMYSEFAAVWVVVSAAAVTVCLIDYIRKSESLGARLITTLATLALTLGFTLLAIGR
jgi:hypothetical protein